MEPQRKRIRSCVCPCPACNGKERDICTVERHTNLFKVTSSTDFVSTSYISGSSFSGVQTSESLSLPPSNVYDTSGSPLLPPSDSTDTSSLPPSIGFGLVGGACVKIFIVTVFLLLVSCSCFYMSLSSSVRLILV